LDRRLHFDTWSCVQCGTRRILRAEMSCPVCGSQGEAGAVAAAMQLETLCPDFDDWLVQTDRESGRDYFVHALDGDGSRRLTPPPVSQNGYVLSRRGRSLPANASGFDTHRDSISSRFDCRGGRRSRPDGGARTRPGRCVQDR
jgi:hypothetical protein